MPDPDMPQAAGVEGGGRRNRRRHPAGAAAAALAGLTFAVTGPISPAGAAATGTTPTDSGPTVNVKGQSVSIPLGIVGVDVTGSGLHVDRVTAFYEGQQASNLRARWFIEDSHGVTCLSEEESEDSGTEAQIVYSRYSDVNKDLPDSGKACAQIYIRDALAGTACVNIYSGTNWSFWN